MKKLYIALLLSVASAFTYAQSIDSTQTSEPKGKINYRKYKWELTTGNILTLLQAPTSDFRTSLFIRKSVNQPIRKEFRTRKVGYRLRVNLNIDHNQRKAETYDSLQNQLNHGNSNDFVFQVGITPGYEWQYQWNRLQVFYGMDVSLSYSIMKSNKDTLSASNTSIESERNIIKSNSNYIYTGISPFLGLKYFISPRLSIAFESNLAFGINFSNNKSESITYSTNYNGDLEITTSSFSNKYRAMFIYFNPLSIIYISYYFN